MTSSRDFTPDKGFLWGQRYWDRAAKQPLPFTSCIACGRKTSSKVKSMGVYISGGGGIIVHPEDYDDYDHQGGEMGWFPIGSECIKTVPVQFHAPNPYENQARGVTA